MSDNYSILLLGLDPQAEAFARRHFAELQYSVSIAPSVAEGEEMLANPEHEIVFIKTELDGGAAAPAIGPPRSPGDPDLGRLHALERHRRVPGRGGGRADPAVDRPGSRRQHRASGQEAAEPVAGACRGAPALPGRDGEG